MEPEKPRKFSSGPLVIASHNPGKVNEIKALLSPFRAEIISAGELGLPEPIEDGDTFAANAKIKALATATMANRPALADDSGLCVHALNGDPGILSARWAGPEKDFFAAMKKIETALTATGSMDRSAHFVCALTLAWPDGHTETLEGQVHGNLSWPPRGEKGFGYDPIFVPQGHVSTFAEMDADKKHAMSHRANAFKKLVQACF